MNRQPETWGQALQGLVLLLLLAALWVIVLIGATSVDVDAADPGGRCDACAVGWPTPRPTPTVVGLPDMTPAPTIPATDTE